MLIFFFWGGGAARCVTSKNRLDSGVDPNHVTLGLGDSCLDGD